MAYISDVTTMTGALAASFVADLTGIPYVSGDMLLLCVAVRQNGQINTPSGWTAIGTNIAATGSTSTTQWFYKIAASSSETNPTITLSTGSSQWVAAYYVVKDVSVATAPVFTRVDIAAANSGTVTMGVVDTTTLGANALVFYSVSRALSAQGSWNPGEICQDAYVNNTLSLAAGHRIQVSAGNTPSSIVGGFDTLVYGGTACTLAFQNATNGVVNPHAEDWCAEMLHGGLMARFREIKMAANTMWNVTGVASTDVFTATGAGFVNGDVVVFHSQTAGAGIGLTSPYWVRDASGDTFKVSLNKGGNAVNLTSDLTAGTVSLANHLFGMPADIASTINSIACEGTTGCRFQLNAENIQSIKDTTSAAAAWHGQIITPPYAASYNLTNKTVIVQFRMNGDPTVILSEGAIIVFGDGTNWTAYNIGKRAALSFVDEQVHAIAVGNAPVYASSGSINWAAVTKIGVLFHRSSSNVSAGYILSRIYAISNPIVITGGAAVKPISPTEITLLFGTTIPKIGPSSGSGQMIQRLPLQIGDGTNKTYFDCESGSIESPLVNNPNKSTSKLDVISSAIQTFTVRTSSLDTYKAAASVRASSLLTNFTIHASSVAPVIADFTSASFIGEKPTFTANLPPNNATFLGCDTVNLDAAHVTGVTVSGSVASLYAADLNDSASILNSSFTKGSETYAIRIQAAGSFDLSGTTFSGYTNDLKITAASGTVTISLAFGQTVPTYSSDGATVVFSQPQKTGSVTGFTAQSHIIVHNVTTDTIIYDQKVAATSLALEYTEGGDFTENDIVDVYHVWMAADWTSATKATKTRTVVGASGWSALITEETCPSYASYYSTYSVTGKTIYDSGDFVRDGANLQIDLDDADDAWYAYRMFMFNKYDIWQNTGNRAWFTKMTSADSGNIDLGAGSTLDNLNVNTAKQQDPVNVTADSGATIGPVQNPTTGGGGITLFSGGKVLTTSTGGLAPSEAQIKSWVRAELATEMARIDAAITSRAAVADIPTASVVADAVWDETLTGSNHNIATSAGRRLRQINAPIIWEGTAQGPGTGTNQIQLDAGASASNGAYDPAIVSIVGGTGAGQSRIILQYVGSTRTATVHRGWRVAPNATSEFIIQSHADIVSVNEGLAQAGGANTITLNTDASSVDGTYVGQLVFIVSGTGEDQCGMVCAYNGTTKVATIEVGNGGSWTTAPDTTSAYVMMPASPILLAACDLSAQKISGLTFTTPGVVDSNIQYVNDVQVKGVGSEADPWNPA